VAAVYDIRNPNQVVVWRRKLDEGGVEALGSRKQVRPNMKPERRCPTPPSPVITDSAQTLREENDRLRAEVAYLKKLQALIRAKRSAAPTKRV
jgi:transposase